MALFEHLKRGAGQHLDARLFGRWGLVRSEPATTTGDSVTAEFTSEGKLTYSIVQGGWARDMDMAYRIDGGSLISREPSGSLEERWQYSFDAEGLLVLDNGGKRSWFKRIA